MTVVADQKRVGLFAIASPSAGEPRPAAEPFAADSPTLDGLVAALRESREVSHNIRHHGRIRRMPSRDTLTCILDSLTAVLFPSHFGQLDLDAETIDDFVRITLDESLRALVGQIRRGLALGAVPEAPTNAFRDSARDITLAFAAGLPALRATLVSDLRAAYDGDPAATTMPEILIGYPGMTAIIHHRLAHRLYMLGAVLPARLIAAIAHSKTGIDIHPAATIGHSFFIDHGTGVVIGETTVIGERVRLYQAVTLGARHFPTDEAGQVIKGAARHPVIEDEVTVYAGATILGRIPVGRGSVIGGNVWLTESVPPGSRITQARLRSTIASKDEVRR